MMVKHIVTEGKKKYILDEKRDEDILNKVRILERLNLDKFDKELISIIKTQLEGDWRKYLLKELDKLLKKYGNRNRL